MSQRLRLQALRATVLQFLDQLPSDALLTTMSYSDYSAQFQEAYIVQCLTEVLTNQQERIIATLTSQLQAAQAELELRSTQAGASSTIQRLQAQLARANQQIARLRTQNSEANAEIKKAGSRLSSSKTQYEAEIKRLSANLQKLSMQSKEAHQFQFKIIELTRERERLSTKLEESKQAMQLLEAKCESQELDLEASAKKVRQLKNQDRARSQQLEEREAVCQFLGLGEGQTLLEGLFRFKKKMAKSSEAQVIALKEQLQAERARWEALSQEMEEGGMRARYRALSKLNRLKAREDDKQCSQIMAFPTFKKQSDDEKESEQGWVGRETPGAKKEQANRRGSHRKQNEYQAQKRKESKYLSCSQGPKLMFEEEDEAKRREIKRKTRRTSWLGGNDPIQPGLKVSQAQEVEIGTNKKELRERDFRRETFEMDKESIQERDVRDKDSIKQPEAARGKDGLRQSEDRQRQRRATRKQSRALSKAHGDQYLKNPNERQMSRKQSRVMSKAQEADQFMKYLKEREGLCQRESSKERQKERLSRKQSWAMGPGVGARQNAGSQHYERRELGGRSGTVANLRSYSKELQKMVYDIVQESRSQSRKLSLRPGARGRQVTIAVDRREETPQEREARVKDRAVQADPAEALGLINLKLPVPSFWPCSPLPFRAFCGSPASKLDCASVRPCHLPFF